MVVRGNEIEVVREAQHNETVDRASVIELIWKEEAKDLLKKHKAYHGMSTFNKRKLHRAIYENVPYGYVHEFLLERMRDRQWGYGKIRRYE